jgi:hypothetical protein
VARVAVLQGEGVVFDHVANPEEVADRWPDVMRLGEASEFRDGAGEQAQWVLQRVERETQ